MSRNTSVPFDERSMETCAFCWLDICDEWLGWTSSLSIWTITLVSETSVSTVGDSFEDSSLVVVISLQKIRKFSITNNLIS